MKTREWLYIIFIVVLLQFIIQVAAWLYGGNSGALNYISFAGTIVSIILAVLAIVYSFVQSISQQSSSEKISSQVEKLIGVTNNIEVSKEGLSDTIRSLSSMAQKIDESIAHQGQIKVQVDNIAAKFDASMTQGAIFSHTSKENPSGVGRNKELGKPFSGMYTGFIMQSLFLYYGKRLGLGLGDIPDSLIMPVLSSFTDVKKGNVRSFKSFNEGLFVGAWQALATNEYIVVDDEMSFDLNENFEAQCEQYIELRKGNTAEDEKEPEDDILDLVIADCEKRVEVLVSEHGGAK